MNKYYIEKEIPEGYEARIEGNKIILEPKESDDERIMKDIITALSIGVACDESALYPEATTTLKEAIAYLEKQKNFQFGYPGFYFYDGEKLHFQGNPAMEENPYDFAMSQQDEQKPAELSEEDETCLEYALWCVMKTRHFVAKDACDLDACRSAERWLKSLPERFNLQPKQEWSETDKLHLNNAILVAKKEWGFNSYTARFLEALRDNYKKCNSHWKPSDEQMRAVFDASERNDKLGSILRNLYDDLKKL